MDREKIAFAAMKPLDVVMGAAVNALKTTGNLERVTDGFYSVASGVMRPVFKMNNSLTTEGAENVPQQGGVLFASNHQSWNDVQVIGVTSPRRVRFLAKGEFEKWPILRHLIALSDSPFIRRGGDVSGMAMAVDSLKAGKALVIFPEGTIPGEEEIGRHQVESDTGLLRGHTGMIRMAVAARVPIVPVGVSGTGRSFPPEVYPRLELLEAPKPVPITVRYGAPIYFEELYGKELDSEMLRKATKKVMQAISKLVDHQRNYVPIEVPIKPLPQYGKIGVLVLHGFTSSVKTVNGLVPSLEAAGLPYRVPVLRGHGTKYTDLAGVKWQDWLEDAEAALLDLAKEVDRVVVVGLSMGGLVALNLAIRHPEKIAGVVTWAAALRFKDPLTPMAPLLAKLFKSWPSPNAFNDPERKKLSDNYPKFMTDSFAQLLELARHTEKNLAQVKVPLCVIQSKKDHVVDPISANVIYRDVSSENREIHWFEKSGHEMGQDLECEAVFKTTMDYLLRFKKGAKAALAAN